MPELTSGDLSSHNVNYPDKAKSPEPGVHGLLADLSGLGGLAFHFLCL